MEGGSCTPKPAIRRQRKGYSMRVVVVRSDDEIVEIVSVGLRNILLSVHSSSCKAGAFGFGVLIGGFPEVCAEAGLFPEGI